jgi:hypothetical protein
MKRPLPIWRVARAWAVWRHTQVWLFLEGGDHAKWPAHMQMIDAVFGVEEV